MYLPERRGQSGDQGGASLSIQGHHPNWGHPDHDACGTGFIARLGSAPSSEIIQIALTALERLTHRGGSEADGDTADSAAMLTSLPTGLFRARAQEQGTDTP